MKCSLLLTAATLFMAGTQAFAAGLPFSQEQTSKGEVLTDSKGITLYTFDKDKQDTSSCYGACAKKWPPFIAAAGATANGSYSLVTRKDGSKQWAFHGMPLYYWVGDTSEGQTNGDGVHGVWHIVPLVQSSVGGNRSW